MQSSLFNTQPVATTVDPEPSINALEGSAVTRVEAHSPVFRMETTNIAKRKSLRESTTSKWDATDA